MRIRYYCPDCRYETILRAIHSGTPRVCDWCGYKINPEHVREQSHPRFVKRTLVSPILFSIFLAFLSGIAGGTAGAAAYAFWFMLYIVWEFWRLFAAWKREKIVKENLRILLFEQRREGDAGGGII